MLGSFLLEESIIGNTEKREIIKMLTGMGEKHGIHQVFVDFLELSALAISNRYDLMQYQEREERYLDIARKYSKEEMNEHAHTLALFIEALKAETVTGRVSDVLGPIYHDLGLHNKWKGQFFSPQEICDMMGAITLCQHPKNEKLTLMEPCAGSGAMVLGFVNAMISQELNYTHNLEVTAIDSDLKCVHMSFLQLALYGIPATVIHGNSLTQEQWSVWRTPMLFMKL